MTAHITKETQYLQQGVQLDLLSPLVEPVITKNVQHHIDQVPVEVDSVSSHQPIQISASEMNTACDRPPRDVSGNLDWPVLEYDADWWNMTAQEAGFDQFVDTDFGIFPFL